MVDEVTKQADTFGTLQVVTGTFVNAPLLPCAVNLLDFALKNQITIHVVERKGGRSTPFVGLHASRNGPKLPPMGQHSQAHARLISETSGP